ncbi:MAG TPA: hypothetical protein DCY88_31345 [Cyanobacteria bacterium UBA11372]|nr:hypothetical protein [Cyanobacteria bacterium UBA11372]
MNDYRAILNRVGMVLIAIGILDIAYWIYCISQGQNYSSSFNFPAVVAGVFLLRGNLRAVPIITWFAVFMLSNFVSGIILIPFLQPADLWATQFRLNLVGLPMSLLAKIMPIPVLFWLYAQLRAAPVASASIRYGNSGFNPKLAFILGIAIAILPVGMMHLTRTGAAGVKAVEIARAKYGENYKYHLTSIYWSNGNVKANLTAYNEQEIKPVQVEWKD